MRIPHSPSALVVVRRVGAGWVRRMWGEGDAEEGRTVKAFRKEDIMDHRPTALAANKSKRKLQ